MIKAVYKIDYATLIRYREEIIRYAAKTADSFSVITEQTKPYSITPPVCRHDSVLSGIGDALLSQTLDVKSWPGTRTSARHMVLNRYRMTKAARAWLLDCSDLLLPGSGLPQDLCFYRGDDAWLYTTTHEKEAAILNPTEKDISFFENLTHFLRQERDA